MWQLGAYYWRQLFLPCILSAIDGNLSFAFEWGTCLDKPKHSITLKPNAAEQQIFVPVGGKMESTAPSESVHTFHLGKSLRRSFRDVMTKNCSPQRSLWQLCGDFCYYNGISLSVFVGRRDARCFPACPLYRSCPDWSRSQHGGKWRRF